MHSTTFDEAINAMFTEFIYYYVNAHPGCNTNDCERAFLTRVKNGWRNGRIIEKSTFEYVETTIETIR